MMDRKQMALQGKISITGKLKILTGMHIGGSSDFAPIGAVDSPFIRDPFTHAPIIPGSSIKGKLRTLLAKMHCKGYLLNTVDKDDEIIARLFGASGNSFACPARLQFFDLFVTQETLNNFNAIETDTYVGEVKFENTISRTTGVANPRQIERVPAGAVFNFKLVYNVERVEEVEQDLQTLKEAFELLENDYLGGHGSRGYGRVKLQKIALQPVAGLKLDLAAYEAMFKD
ncbi:type III-A CRISPR-associated RAMP protein Csm3 [uncultured Phascolarctobacterium sp.]|uniref:type III-A CRISPR-associated RAMP protein Csm3 n=1 Tax=uncultured Phascolarctobacterium sp. TaxID=512296 RepID=UPI0025D032A6|nr:type III-A CRISPR-associated RAMP protein Csm3 [uncultured Phascolarctobacterium sp.]